MIGLDTAAFVDLLRGNQQLGKKIEELNLPLIGNRISYLELMFGINKDFSKDREQEELIDGIFESVRVFELDKNSSKKASEVFQQLKKAGFKIEGFDCAIAGILLSNGINKIITRNVKHFEKIKGLKVISY